MADAAAKSDNPTGEGRPFTVADADRCFLQYEQKLRSILQDLGVTCDDDISDIILQLFTELIERIRRAEAVGEAVLIEDERQFLYQLVRNAGRRFLSSKKRPTGGDSSGMTNSPVDPADMASDEMPSTGEPRPISMMATQESLSRAKSALYNHLPEDLQRIVLLHDGQGRTFEEIAAEIGLTREQARRRYEEAKVRFQDRLARFDSDMVREGDDRHGQPSGPREILEAFGQLPKPYGAYLDATYRRKHTPTMIAGDEKLTEATIRAKLDEAHRLFERRFRIGREELQQTFGIAKEDSASR